MLNSSKPQPNYLRPPNDQIIRHKIWINQILINLFLQEGASLNLLMITLQSPIKANKIGSWGPFLWHSVSTVKLKSMSVKKYWKIAISILLHENMNRSRLTMRPVKSPSWRNSNTKQGRSPLFGTRNNRKNPKLLRKPKTLNRNMSP